MKGKAPQARTKSGAQSTTVDVSPLAQIPIGMLSSLITPAIMEAVCARLDLTPEKLTLMIVRLINPDEILTKGEEAKLRGVTYETLAGMRANKELRPL